MRTRYRVALLGFNAVERGALGLCMQYTTGRDIGYEEVEQAGQADFLIADQSAEDVAERVRADGRLRDTVFVGEQPVPGALSQVTRPIDPDAVVQELDELLALRRAEANGLTVELGLPLDERMPSFEPEALRGANGPSSIERAADLASPAALPLLDELAFAPAEPQAPTDSQAPRASQAPPESREAREPQEPAAAKAAARRAARRARLRDNPAPHGPADVLVLDDSELARLHLCRLLGDFGFRAHAVGDSESAWALLAAQPFAVALFDVVLGEADAIDGIELCHRLKRAAPLAPAPIVMLVSGHAQPADQVRARLAGCDAFLTKPVSRGSLAGALESCRVALPADARRS